MQSKSQQSKVSTDSLFRKSGFCEERKVRRERANQKSEEMFIRTIAYILDHLILFEIE